MSLGDQLRSAREKKGLTINDIARTTYIRAHYLDAIEQDDFSTIPPSRLRYFVQDYAKSVDLDPARLLQEIPEDIPAPPPPVPAPTTAPPSRTAPSRSLPFVGKAAKSAEGKAAQEKTISVKKSFGSETGEEEVVAEAAVPVREKTKREPRRRRPRYSPLDQGNPALVRGLMTVAVLLLVAVGIYFLTGGFDRNGGEEGETDTTVATEAGDTAGAAGNDTRILSRSENVPDTNAVAEEAGGDSLTLQGRATAEVWYSIKMDNRQETGTLDSGEVKVWKAEKEFRVSLGNAGGLDFSLNGRPIGALGPKQTSLRNKVIDADGVRTSSTSTARPRTSSASSSRGRTSRRTTQQAAPSSRLRSLETTEPRRVDPE